MYMYMAIVLLFLGLRIRRLVFSPFSKNINSVVPLLYSRRPPAAPDIII